MPSSDFKRIVVNASVACAAGGVNAKATESISCTEFLETFRDKTPHHVIMTPELLKEWQDHQSNYAATWLSNMISIDRFDFIELPEAKTFSNEIEATATLQKDINNLLKDLHLIQAALKTDMTVISLDENIRSLFAKASKQVDAIKNIIWVNPNHTAEHPIEWLEKGAPPENHRLLSTYSV